MSDLVKELRESTPIIQEAMDADEMEWCICDHAADLIEQLQQRNFDLEKSAEVIMQQRDNYRHERTALAIESEQLQKQADTYRCEYDAVLHENMGLQRERDELAATVERLRADNSKELLNQFAQYLNERCDLNVSNMVRPFMEDREC